MNKNIKWFLDRLFHIAFAIITELIIRKNSTTWLFGFKSNSYNNSETFMQNSKYMFLYLSDNTNINAVWLCDDKNMISEFHKYGYSRVYKRNSLQGILALLTAKYWFCDITPNQVSKFNSILTRAKIINFWHGAGGLKKVGYDAVNSTLNTKFNKFQQTVYNSLNAKNNYFVVNSTYEANCRKTAFKAKDKEILIIGSPRIDVLYKDIEHSDIFMQEDFRTIKNFKEEGKKLIIYMPTYRDTGKNIFSWLNSSKLNEFLKNSNTILICKFHPHDTNELKDINENFYKMANNSDVYPILKYTDALITDYSSIYFDYLHLNKPIVYYIPDLEEYKSNCRGFYRSYESLTAGEYTKTEEELFNALRDTINGMDRYKDKRNLLLTEMFMYQDGNNSKRVTEFIKGLRR